MSETRIKTEDGYTLIEVLIAISIFMIGVLAVASLQASALRSNSHSMGLTEAVNAAQEQIEDILAIPYDPDEDIFKNTNTKQVSSSLGEQYEIVWEVVGEHDWDGDTIPEAARINVTVSWSGVSGDRSINFNFLKTTRF